MPNPIKQCPKVSVLMTIYNAAPYLSKSIESILAQTFGDWELVAVENGSTDNSSAILSEFSDPRMVVVKCSENIGRTPALRYAFDRSRGSYIAILDADDISHPHRLALQAEYLDRNPDVALVGSWAEHIDEHEAITAWFTPPVATEDIANSIGWTNPIVHSSAMFRREKAANVGGYPPELTYAQDFGLVIALAGNSKIAIIDQFLCKLRVLRSSMTRSQAYQIQAARETLYLLGRAERELKLNNFSRRLNHRAKAIATIRLGLAMLKSGAFLEGVWMAIAGTFSDPTVIWNNGWVLRRLNRTADWYWLRSESVKRT